MKITLLFQKDKRYCCPEIGCHLGTKFFDKHPSVDEIEVVAEEGSVFTAPHIGVVGVSFSFSAMRGEEGV